MVIPDYIKANKKYLVAFLRGLFDTTSVNHKTFVGYDVVVRNKNTAKFFEIVGSRNPRNSKKYKNMGTRGISRT